MKGLARKARAEFNTFHNILSWADIQRILTNLHDDYSTPWTFAMMVRQCRFATIPWQRFSEACKGKLRSHRYQILMSRFCQEIESGALRVYYANPEARRHIWGDSSHIVKDGKILKEDGTCKRGDELDPGIRAKRAKNKVIVEFNKPATEQKILSVSIGKDGPWLKPGMRKIHNFKMPGEK